MNAPKPRLPAGARSLVDWDFAAVPAGSDWRDLPDTSWRHVTVPHVAEGELSDVRRGGQVAYRTTLLSDGVAGTHELTFDGVSYRCEILVNDRRAGGHEGAWDPFTVDVGWALVDGENVVVVLVDLPDYDPASPFHFRTVLLGFVPDTVGPFGGLWKPVTYRRRPLSHVVTFRVVVDQDGGAIEVTWDTHLGAGHTLEVEVRSPDGAVLHRAVTGEHQGSTRLACPQAERWSPAHPALHVVRLRLMDGSGETVEKQERKVGFRRIRVDGSRILLDDEPLYIRGALHWGHYPGLSAPAPDRARARTELELLLSLGFNAVKFCLFIAPEHYYELCDELGMLVWQEFPLWLPRDNGAMETRIREQYPRLIDMVSSRPSLTLVSLGCELDDTVPTAVLDWAYDLVHASIPQVLVCANSGSGECFGGGADAKSDIYDYHFYADPHELDELMTEFTRDHREPRPWLFGEYNDADTWRTAAELFSTAEPRPAWLSAAPQVNALRSVHAGFASDQPVYRQAEIIAEAGYADEVQGLRELSHAQASEVRKLTWELTRTHSAIGGYVVTTIRDVPTMTSGLIDDRERLKFDPADMARVNGDAVLAVRSPLRRRWYRGGDRIRVLDPYNATAGEPHAFGLVLANATARSGPALVEVGLEVDGEVVLVDRRSVDLDAHSTRHLLDVEWTPVRLKSAKTSRARLVATVTTHGRTLAANSWPVLLHAARPNGARLVVHDPGARLDGLADWFGARPTSGRDELHEAVTGESSGGGPRGRAAALVTTEYSDEIRELTARHGLNTFVVGDGSFFRSASGPFWRENVKRVNGRSWLADAVPTEHAGTPFHAVAGDHFVPREEVRRVVGDYTPLLTRYDARTYAVSEYLFEWREGRGRTAYSTLRFSGGTGTQPRVITDNPLALAVLGAFVARASWP